MSKPRVSLGVPVYNGQRFIRATLDSLLAQTFTDFELIICDNCSTDGTESICREYAAKDTRVRYFRNERNLGPAPNYNRCFELSRGELFKWCAADDLCAPELLDQSIAMLDADPRLVAVYTRTVSIDPDGNELSKYDRDLDLDVDSPALRLKRLIFANHRRHTAHELFSVIRSDVLRRTQPTGSYPSADRVMIARLVLHGPVGRVDKYLFFNREHPQRSTHSTTTQERRIGSKLSRYIGGGPTPAYEWWDPSMRGKIVFPEWRWVWEYLQAVRKATGLRPPQRLACYAVVAGLYLKFIPRLGRDLVIASEQASYRLFGRGGGVPTAAH
jgi:glycosyltransferase involved in cell wall biosynthesis